MDNLIKAITGLQGKLDRWRRESLKETSTRTIIIDPLLEALQWDVRDPDEVQLEYPTVDNKSVDYALKINDKPVLLIEAKALTDDLSDVKATTQVVGYAANDGIPWCVLTNGIKWRVYKTDELAQAPDKLMFEVSLDPRENEGLEIMEIAETLWRCSREEIAKGTLSELGERTFTDGKVRKALNNIMGEPPRALVNLVTKSLGDSRIKTQKIKESLIRIWSQDKAIFKPETPINEKVKPKRSLFKTRMLPGTRKGRKGKRPRRSYEEKSHTLGKPKEVLELYSNIDRLCLSLVPGGITKEVMAKSINYFFNDRPFCAIHILKTGLKVWLHIKYDHLPTPPHFARDVSKIGHWGPGDLELRITQISQLKEAIPFIRQSLENVS